MRHRAQPDKHEDWSQFTCISPFSVWPHLSLSQLLSLANRLLRWHSPIDQPHHPGPSGLHPYQPQNPFYVQISDSSRVSVTDQVLFLVLVSIKFAWQVCCLSPYLVYGFFLSLITTFDEVHNQIISPKETLLHSTYTLQLVQQICTFLFIVPFLFYPLMALKCSLTRHNLHKLMVCPSTFPYRSQNSFTNNTEHNCNHSVNPGRVK